MRSGYKCFVILNFRGNDFNTKIDMLVDKDNISRFYDKYNGVVSRKEINKILSYYGYSVSDIIHYDNT